LVVFLINRPKPNREKNMAYECGFKPFDFLYYPFDVQFYRVGILFLLFDVEIMFLFPWVLNFYSISTAGHGAVLGFVILLFIGFLYELKVGALNWYPQAWYKE
jgi:NADH-quinone oxidoreductase subunit A